MSEYMILTKGGVKFLFRNVDTELDEACGPVLIPCVWNISNDASFSTDALETCIGVV